MIKPVIVRLAALAGTRVRSYGRCEIIRLLPPGKSIHPLVAEYFRSAIPGSPVELFDYRLCSRRELRSTNEKLIPGGFESGLILIGSTPCGDQLAIDVRSGAVHVLSHELLWASGRAAGGPLTRSQIMKAAIARFAGLPVFLCDWERRARAHVEEQRAFARTSRRDPNARDAQGWTPLHHAALFGEEKKARTLLARGANVQVEDRQGETPLFYACKIGSVPVARLLLSAGAEVDHRNHEHVTPLMWAVHFSNLSCIKLLLKAGADPDARDNAKQRAIDRICPVHGTARIRQTLRTAMRKAGPSGFRG